MNTINIWLQQVETRVISQVVQYGADCEIDSKRDARLHACWLRPALAKLAYCAPGMGLPAKASTAWHVCS
jgi:hypothetical protein